MLLYVLPAVAGLTLLGVTFTYESMRAETGAVPTLSRMDLVQYQQFMFAADQFMKSANAPTAPGVVTWDTIRASSTTPPGMRSLGVPFNWRVVKTADSWVACTEVSQKTAASLNQFMPSTSTTTSGSSTATLSVKDLPINVEVTGGNKDGYVVLGAESSTKALELATACKAAGS